MFTSGAFFSKTNTLSRGGTWPQFGLYTEGPNIPQGAAAGIVGPIQNLGDGRYDFDKPDRHTPTDEFMTRFGLTAIAKRNSNVMDMLTRPGYAVAQINREYYALAQRLWRAYNFYYQQLLIEGIPKGYAQQAADEYILPQIDAELKLMELKYPYTFGGANGAQGAADEAGRMLFTTRQAGQGAQSLAATQHINHVIGANVFGTGKKKKKHKLQNIATGSNAVGS